MRFSSFGITINAHEIVNAITHHGVPVFHTSEMHIKPFLCRRSACNLADIIALYKKAERFYIVGIEIKEWDAPVNSTLAVEYLETYRRTCEYFYLAAKHFSKKTLGLKEIGLIDLNEMKTIKRPEYLFPDTGFRANMMKRIKKQFNILHGVVEDPYQRTLLEFEFSRNEMVSKTGSQYENKSHNNGCSGPGFP
ncbi:MAG TPA: hypothetical protein VIO11_10550 [Candidatus Methanoperedens sp.]